MALAPERLELLLQWKEIVPKIVEILKELLPDAEIYLGSVARDDYDAWSDVDILVVTNKKLSKEERIEVMTGLWEEMERRGLPWHFPWELHFAVKGEETKYPERRKLI